MRCLIIGSGPAGYTAAIYAARANMQPVLIEGPQPGGQLTITTEVENFPGYPDGVEPYQMMDDLRRQAERFGTQFVSAIVDQVELSPLPSTEEAEVGLHKVRTDDGTLYETETLIIATGASARWLGLPSEQEYRGRGVSACATCDGFFYRGKTVAVVGGGDTACEEALYLANLCKKVYMIVRKPFLRASQIMQQRVAANEKIEVLFEHNTLRLTGEQKVQGADLIFRKGEADEQERHIEIDGFFLAIGHHPNTDLFRGQIALNDEGYILTEPDTSRCLSAGVQKDALSGEEKAVVIPGVFAAGDCMDPHYRQAVVAAAAGCKAALDAEHYLNSKR